MGIPVDLEFGDVTLRCGKTKKAARRFFHRTALRRSPFRGTAWGAASQARLFFIAVEVERQVEVGADIADAEVEAVGARRDFLPPGFLLLCITVEPFRFVV